MANLYLNKFLSGKKILFLGDSIMGSDRYDGEDEETKGVPDLVSDYTGATVVNLGVPGSRIVSRSGKDQNEVTGEYVDKNCLDQTEMIKNMITNDFTNLKKLVSEKSSKGSQATKAAIIKEQKEERPFKNFSIIILAYGTNDWFNNNFLYDQKIYNSGKVSLKEGAITILEKNIDTLQKNFPQSKILVLTPIWRYGYTNQVVWDGDTKNDKGDNYTLKEWAAAIEKKCKEKRVAVLNTYINVPLSLNNRTYYFDKNGEDGTHLNYNGNKLYASIISSKLREVGEAFN